MSKKDKDILIYEFKKTRGTRDSLLIALKKCFEQLHDQQAMQDYGIDDYYNGTIESAEYMQTQDIDLTTFK